MPELDHQVLEEAEEVDRAASPSPQQTPDSSSPPSNKTEEEPQADANESLASSSPELAVRINKETEIHDERSEEEKIKEYMSRSDTAVIYPEEPADSQPSIQLPHNEPSSNEFALKCCHCDTGVFTGANAVESLKEHVRTCHQLKYPFNNNNGLPSTDGKETPEPIKVLAEEKNSSKKNTNGSYRCDKCSASFANIDCLEKHLLLHSPTTQSCRVCHKTFANVYRLQRHMISHDESAVLRKFKCPECEKAFKFKHHLKEHIRIHSGEKPFECPNCGKRFSHSGSYSSHMTSKKCLVVNLKVRRSVDKSIRGKRNSNNNNNNTTTNNNILRPIIPKYGDEPQEPFKTSSSQISSPVYSEHFPPTAAAMLTSSYSQPPSMQPFLPNPSFPSIGLHPLLASHFHSSGVTPNPYLASSLAAMAASLPDLHTNFRSKAAEEKSPINDCKSPLSEPEIAAKREEDEKDLKDLNAVKKILEIVDATAKQQKCEAEDTSANVGMKCKYCDAIFESPIALHQHERYLCSENKMSPMPLKTEIKTEGGTDSAMEDCCKPGSSSTGTGDSDDDSARDNIDEDSCVNDDGSRKWRVRSLFSEEHLHILKSFYKVNPRPKKYDVERLANQIGFATRVVQVWFQNMRARDRRRGRHIQVPSSNHNAANYPSLVHAAAAATYNAISASPNLGAYYSQQSQASPPPALKCVRMNTMHSNGTGGSPCSSPNSLRLKSTPMNASDEQPLDLSMKNKDESSSSDDALNLSHKSSRTSTPSRESNSSIDNMPYTKESLGLTLSSSPASHFLSSLKSRSLLANSEKVDLRYLHRYPPTSLSSLQHILSIPPLHPLSEHANLATSTSSKVLNMQTDVPSPTSYSHSEYNSDDALVIDDGSAKSVSKRPWPHMDADDSMDDDGLKPSKDWKQQGQQQQQQQHGGNAKVIEGFATLEDGMYSCDQCDKMFSKQSSLARHKYEHSGQRPHKCEQCGKAFKHKHHLTEHRRLHSGEKPFQCKKCLKRFSHSGSYSQHMNHRYSYCKPYRE